MPDIRARRSALAAVIAVALALPAGATDDEPSVVQAVVEAAYVRGVHARFDAEAMRRGFHPDFRMLVLREGRLEAVTLEEWIARLEQRRREQPAAAVARVTHGFTFTDVAGPAASVRVELHRDGRHAFSDYLSLYKFPDGWKIVSKTFFAR